MAITLKKKTKTLDDILAPMGKLLKELQEFDAAQDTLQADLDKQLLELTAAKAGSAARQQRARLSATRLSEIVNPSMEEIVAHG